MWLTSAGWRERGSGIFDELGEWVEAARQGSGHSGGRDRLEVTEESRFIAALIALTLISEPVFGRAARRSVTLPGDAETQRRFRSWLVELFERLMEAP